MRHRISERARRSQRVIHSLRVQVVSDGMARYESVIFAFATSQRVLCRPNFDTYQRISRMNNVRSDINGVDFFNF